MRKKKLLISLDWVDIRNFKTLVAACNIKGRAIWLLWQNMLQSGLNLNMYRMEVLLMDLRRLLPPTLRVGPGVFLGETPGRQEPRPVLAMFGAVLAEDPVENMAGSHVLRRGPPCTGSDPTRLVGDWPEAANADHIHDRSTHTGCVTIPPVN